MTAWPEPCHKDGRVAGRIGYEAVGRRPRHRGVIGLLPRQEPKRASTDDIGKQVVAVPWAELERGAERIADYKPLRPLDAQSRIASDEVAGPSSGDRFVLRI